MPQSEQEFLAAVGRLTLTWALVEFPLDAAISVIHQELGGKTIERVAPAHIGRKVTYLKRCLRKLTALSPFQSYIPLMNEIKSAVEFRKKIVHGCLAEYPITGDEIKMFNLLHSDDSVHTQKPITVTVAMIEMEANKAMTLAAQSTNFAKGLIDTFLK